jgi:hypothetical protein
MGVSHPLSGVSRPSMGVLRPLLGPSRPSLGSSRPSLGRPAPSLGAFASAVGAPAPAVGASGSSLGAAGPGPQEPRLVVGRPGPFERQRPGGLQDVRQRLGGPHPPLHPVQRLDPTFIGQAQRTDRLAALADLEGEFVGTGLPCAAGARRPGGCRGTPRWGEG